MLKWKVEGLSGEYEITFRHLEVANNGNVMVVGRYDRTCLLRIFDRNGDLIFETNDELVRESLNLEKIIQIWHPIISRDSELVYVKVFGHPNDVLLGFNTDGKIKVKWDTYWINEFDVSDDGLVGVLFIDEEGNEYCGLLDSSGRLIWKRRLKENEVLCVPTGHPVSISRNSKYVGFFFCREESEYVMLSQSSGFTLPWEG